MKKFVIFLFYFFFYSSLYINHCFSQSGWFYQPLPFGYQINDLKFFDANTGLVCRINPQFVVRTTNGGYNWNTTLSYQGVYAFDIIDSNCVYGIGTGIVSDGILLRSYDRGTTWDSLIISNAVTVNGISFINRDTGWVGGTSGGLPFLWRTVNAGLNWTVQSDNTGFGPVFFLKNKINGEYYGWSINYSNMWKTTNSGNNWFQVMDAGNASRLQFLNKDTGFASTGDNIKKTINGGINWNAYYLPTDSGIVINQMMLFKIQNKDTIYADYGTRYLGNGRFSGVIWLSTNGGVNWGFQQPDTSIHHDFIGIDFANKDTGWSCGIRTNDRGGPVIIAGINHKITRRAEKFQLEQNYPNPFNPSTRIDFSVSFPSYISLSIFDLSGKEIIKIYNIQYFFSGNYYVMIDVNKLKLASGIYFYKMTVMDTKGKDVYQNSKRMVFLK
jgi:hypothetical protein